MEWVMMLVAGFDCQDSFKIESSFNKMNRSINFIQVEIQESPFN